MERRPQQSKKEDAPNVSRRRFLADAAKVMGGGFAGAVPIGVLEYNFLPKGERMNITLPLIAEYLEINGGYENRTPAEQDAVREDFLSRVDYIELQEHFVKAEKEGTLSNTYGMLAMVSCQGLLEQYMRDEGIYHERPQVAGRFHYMARVADFLPTSKEIEEEDIDTRLNVLHYGGRDEEERERIMSTIQKNNGWSDHVRIAFFGVVLDDPDVRTSLQSSNCTLAEAYSLIKAVVVFFEDNPETQLKEKAVMEQMLTARDTFCAETILGPDTEHYIHMSCHEKKYKKKRAPQFHVDELRGLARACGVQVENEHEINTSQDETGVVQDLFNAIASSRGKTVIHLDTHGLEDGMNLSIKEGSEVFLSVADIAHDLLARLSGSQDTESLADVSIILSSCFSGGLTENLINNMRYQFENNSVDGKTFQEVIGVPFNSIALPTVVAQTQVGSFAYSTGAVANILPVAKKEGRFTGEMLMRQMQPRDYYLADYAFFQGQHGDVKVIGNSMLAVDQDKMSA